MISWNFNFLPFSRWNQFLSCYRTAHHCYTLINCCSPIYCLFLSLHFATTHAGENVDYNSLWNAKTKKMKPTKRKTFSWIPAISSLLTDWSRRDNISPGHVFLMMTHPVCVYYNTWTYHTSTNTDIFYDKIN